MFFECFYLKTSSYKTMCQTKMSSRKFKFPKMEDSHMSKFVLFIEDKTKWNWGSPKTCYEDQLKKFMWQKSFAVSRKLMPLTDAFGGHQIIHKFNTQRNKSVHLQLSKSVHLTKLLWSTYAIIRYLVYTIIWSLKYIIY